MVDVEDVAPHRTGSSAVKDIAFGSIAGMTSKLFEHPFDLVKVRLQSQPTDRPPTYKGPLDCFQKTWNREGLKGLYRGISAPIVGAAAENACLFLVYNKCQDLLRRLGDEQISEKALGKQRELGMSELAVSAAAAGAAASFVLTPIELVKCKMQVQRLAREGLFGDVAAMQHTAASSTRPYSTAVQPPVHRSLPGPFAIVGTTVRQHGLRGLWLGQTGTLLRETGGSSAWFSAYELVTRALISHHQKSSAETITKKDLKMWELMIAGACAGMSYNLVLFPADSVKSAMQTEEELRGSSGSRPQFWKMARDIYRSRGLAGLYAGCGLTVARAAPSSAMIFMIYETLESKFGHYL